MRSSLSELEKISVTDSSLPIRKAETVADYICDFLAGQAISHVFMVPGGYVDNFAHGIVNTERLSAFVAASEAGAAMMADGYARASRKFGVCLGISGPGATNMITSLSLSNADQVPVLAITGEPPLNWRDRGAIQDPGRHGIRSIELMAIASRYQYQVLDPKAVPAYMRRALTALTASNTGVVNLSVPMDLQSVEHKIKSDAKLERIHGIRVLDVDGLQQMLALVSEHKNVAMLVGAGIRRSEAAESLLAFAEMFSIPVATTMSAKGDFPEDHDLSLGVFGWAGSPQANETLMGDDVDCLIVVGSKLGQIATMNWSERLRNDRVMVHVDVNSEHIDNTYSSDLPIVSDAKAAFDCMIAQYRASPSATFCIGARKNWLHDIKGSLPRYERYQSATASLPIHPAEAIVALSEISSPDTQVFVDNGAHNFYASHYWKATRENQFFNAIKYSGAMGWAIGAAIGANIAQPDKPTIAFVGDGCMLMHGIEIQSAARYGLNNIVFVVVNNRAHGNPKLRAADLSHSAQDITDIVDHSWADFAASLGVKGFTISQPKDLSSVYQQALAHDGAVLIDIKCGLYETPTKMFDDTFMKEFNENLSF